MFINFSVVHSSRQADGTFDVVVKHIVEAYNEYLRYCVHERSKEYTLTGKPGCWQYKLDGLTEHAATPVVTTRLADWLDQQIKEQWSV